MRDVPFIDAHVHFWDLAHIAYPWLTPPFADDGPNGSVEPIASTYRPPDYRAEAADWNVVGAVHVDAGADPAAALDETRWLEAQADASGLPSGIVAFADLADPGVDRLLGAHASHPRVRGIRHIVNWHADPGRTYSDMDATLDPRWERGFALLARYNLSFDLQCYPGQMTHIAGICARHPDVPVIINHMGMPVLADAGGLEAWRDGMARLAALPQVSVKLSGLGFIRRDWDEPLALPLIRETIDLFGPYRAMAASDFPTDRLFSSFNRALGTLAEAINSLSGAERRAIWGGNANRIYRLGLDALLGDAL